jgi:polyisoprenoid-binding protein YceI
VGALAATTQLGTGVWIIDPVHSTIGFWVRHLMVSKVRGTFDTFAGAITLTDEGTPSVTVEIDVTSISTGHEQRDRYVTSAGFFDAHKFPTATFTSTGVNADGDDHVLEGDFTLKGVTKPVSLKLQFTGMNPGIGQNEVSGFEASVVLNRKDFGLDIDLPLDTGGMVVGDKVTITLEIEAIKQA